MAYKVQNIIIGAAALFVSVLDSTQSTWIGGTGLLGPNLPTLATTASGVAAGAGGAVYLGNDTTAASWRHVGFTSEGVELSYEPSYGDVEVDQLLDSAKIFKSSMRVTANTTLTEATLDNLLIVWGQQGSSLKAGATTGFDSDSIASGESELGIAAGSLGDEPVERGLVFVGPAPRAATTNKKRERLYHVRRAISVETTAHALRRAEATTLPVSFRLLPDPGRTGAEYGLIRDRLIEP